MSSNSNQLSTSTSATDQSSANTITEQPKTRMFNEKLTILNENFIRFLRNAYNKQPMADFTPAVKDYLKHLHDLDSMYYTPTAEQTSSSEVNYTTAARTTSVSVQQEKTPIIMAVTTTALTATYPPPPATSISFGLPPATMNTTQTQIPSFLASTSNSSKPMASNLFGGFSTITPGSGFTTNQQEKAPTPIFPPVTTTAAAVLPVTSISFGFPPATITTTQTQIPLPFPSLQAPLPVATVVSATATATPPTQSVFSSPLTNGNGGIRSRKRGADTTVDDMWKQHQAEGTRFSPFDGTAASLVTTTAAPTASLTFGLPPATTASQTQLQPLFTSTSSNSSKPMTSNLFGGFSAITSGSGLNASQKEKTPTPISSPVTTTSTITSLPATATTISFGFPPATITTQSQLPPLFAAGTTSNSPKPMPNLFAGFAAQANGKASISSPATSTSAKTFPTASLTFGLPPATMTTTQTQIPSFLTSTSNSSKPFSSNLFGGFSGITSGSNTNQQEKASTSLPSTTTSIAASVPIASFTFSTPPTTTTSQSQLPPLFSFGGTSNKPLENLFGANLSKPMTSLFGGASGAATITRTNADEDGEEGEEPEKFVPKDNIQPLVPLPPKVSVQSGEEGEQVSFEARCKLFRYDRDSKENKERGIGELKILRNIETGRHRCLVRNNESGLAQLYANFPIIAGFQVEDFKKPNIKTWHCKDFSEKMDEGKDEILIAKFRDEETAKEFQTKVNDLGKISTTVAGSSSTSP